MVDLVVDAQGWRDRLAKDALGELVEYARLADLGVAQDEDFTQYFIAPLHELLQLIMLSSSASSSDSEVKRSRHSSSRSVSAPRPKPEAAGTVQTFKAKIARLPAGVSEGHLREIFQTFGKVVAVVVAGPEVTYLPSKRAAVVQFADATGLASAVEFMHNGQINGHVVAVTEMEDGGRERSREREKHRKDDDNLKKNGVSNVATEKKTTKNDQDDTRGKQKVSKDKSGKDSKPKESGRFKRSKRHGRSSSNSSESDSSKRDSSESSRSSSSSLSESSNSSSD